MNTQLRRALPLWDQYQAEAGTRLRRKTNMRYRSEIGTVMTNATGWAITFEAEIEVCIKLQRTRGSTRSGLGLRRALPRTCAQQGEALFF